MVVDETTARILERYLDESEWYPEDDEYPGDPKIHHATLFGVLGLYHEQQLDDALGKPVADEERVTALEALACDRLLMEALRVQRYGLVFDARKAGGSWADVGSALGVARQSAHEMYAQDLAERAEWWKGRVGAEDFTKHRPEYESVLNEK
jgi:hypothetical protein